MQAALLPFGIVAGVLAQAHGLSFAATMLMAGVVFAGAGQVLALGNWGHPIPVIGAIVACVTVNLRMMLMGPALSPWLDRLRGWRLWGSLFFMADHNWALSITDMRSGGRDAAFLTGSGIGLWTGWVAGEAVGWVAGGLLQPPPGHPVFFIALAVFIALLVPMWRGRREAMPWAVAAVTALGVSRLFPGTYWHVVVAALAGSTAGVLRDRLRQT